MIYLLSCLLISLWHTCCLVCSFHYRSTPLHQPLLLISLWNASCSVCSFHYRSSPANHHRCLFLYEMFVIPFAHFSIWLTTPTPPSLTTTKYGCTHTNPTTKRMLAVVTPPAQRVHIINFWHKANLRLVLFIFLMPILYLRPPSSTSHKSQTCECTRSFSLFCGHHGILISLII